MTSCGPLIVGSITLPHYAYSIALSPDGTKAYVALGNAGIKIFNVSNPTNPYKLDNISTLGWAQAVAVSSDGTKVFVAEQSAGLQIMDVTNPEKPEKLGSITLGKSNLVMDVILSPDNKKAYISFDNTTDKNYSGVCIIDVANPEKPKIDSCINLKINDYKLAISPDGRKLFIAGGFLNRYHDFIIVDVSNAADPKIIKKVWTSDWAVDIAISRNGTKAYVADSDSGLLIYDVSYPENPKLIGSVKTADSAQSLAITPYGLKVFVLANYYKKYTIKLYDIIITPFSKK